MAEWLYNLSIKSIDNDRKIHMNDCAFKHACSSGYKDRAEWLYNLSKIDNNTKININTDNDEVISMRKRSP